MKKLKGMKQRENTASLCRRPHGLFVSSDRGGKRHAGTDMESHEIDTTKIGRAMYVKGKRGPWIAVRRGNVQALRRVELILSNRCTKCHHSWSVVVDKCGETLTGPPGA